VISCANWKRLLQALDRAENRQLSSHVVAMRHASLRNERLERFPRVAAVGRL
jgi:hypothetical protein